jgi:cell division septal protein FtsQ
MKWLILSLVFLGALGFWLWQFLPPVQKVEVRGNRVLSLKELENLLLPELSGRNLFKINLKKIGELLLKDPKIARCEIWKVYPYTLRLKIEEKDPLGFTFQHEETQSLIKEMAPLAIKKEGDFYVLLTQEGIWFRLKESQLSEGLKVLKSFQGLLGEKKPNYLLYVEPDKVIVGFGKGGER